MAHDRLPLRLPLAAQAALCAFAGGARCAWSASFARLQDGVAYADIAVEEGFSRGITVTRPPLPFRAGIIRNPD
jgi:hypothetical protein